MSDTVKHLTQVKALL